MHDKMDDLEDITLSDKSERERSIPYDFAFMWKLKNKMNSKTRL